MSPLLRLYLAFSQVSDPIWRWQHRKRLKKGKEVAARLHEKYGEYPAGRPEAPVLWFHALSVGESLALLPLIERALKEYPGAHVVLTTSTATSAEAIARIGLPDRCLHILLPIDTKKAATRFLDYWQPAIAVFAELDFWPRLMVETKSRGIPLVLVNSRMSPRNFDSRKRLGGMMEDVLGLFDALLLQDGGSFDRFAALGADPTKMSVVGPLKAAARPLPAVEEDLIAAGEAVGPRPVWLAAATRHIEDARVLDAHMKVTREQPDSLLILAPRHVAAGEEAEAMAQSRFTHVARRSRGEMPDARCQVYIADTIGEMGIWYRIAPISFVGHSLVSEEEVLTGKNPYEAAALGSAILHGPMVSDFSETYEGLTRAGAAVEVEDAETLAAAVLRLMEDAQRDPMISAASRVIAARTAILDNTWAVLQRALASRL